MHGSFSVAVNMRTIKQGIRIVGIDDSPFEKHGPERSVLVVGVVQRGDIVEGVLSTTVTKDGNDATQKTIAMIKESRFLSQVRLILLNSIMLAGFNVVDIQKIHKQLGIPVIALTRRKPNMAEVASALRKSSRTKAGYGKKIAIVNRAGVSKEVSIRSKIVGLKKAYIQTAGIDAEEAQALLNKFGIEPLRLAHIIGSGVVTGESSGRI
jgi:hypothetical protein